MRIVVSRAYPSFPCALACLLALLTSPADAKPRSAATSARSCIAEIGPRRAEAMRRECRLVAPASACQPDASCATWAREIARACEAAGADALPVCEAHGAIDDEEEDDDE